LTSVFYPHTSRQNFKWWQGYRHGDQRQWPK
jgi:hypothetical protein